VVARIENGATSPSCRTLDHLVRSAGFDDLAASAITYEAFGVEVRAASLEDILRSKRASDRPQDRQDVIIPREMLKRR